MKKFITPFICLALLFPGIATTQNTDFMMQGWYWDYFQNGNYGGWINNLNAKATELQTAGFKHIWLPPLSRSSTTNNISNGYNPKDLYDLGEFGPACAWGTRTQLNTLISNYNSHGLNVISDMIYNHRDGGKPEKNDAVRYYVTTPGTANPYPSDRFYCVLPLGSTNPGNNGAGDYYIKVRSKAQNNGYGPYQYRFYARTNNSASTGIDVAETEPNGGGDCGQPFNAYTLGGGVIANLYDYSGCYTDEFKITLTAGNFNSADDTLFIYLNNYNSGYADQYVYGLYSAPRNSDIVNELQYWTYSNYNNLPSGQGGMNYNAFRPNDNTANSGGVTESLGCDWNCPLFFYDYDQNQQVTKDVLNAWTQWELQAVGVKGLRMDAVKNFDPAFVSQLMNYLYSSGAIPQLTVGEYFDYDAFALKGWLDAVYSGMTSGAQGAIKVRAFDFSLRGALKDACDLFGYDVRNLFNSGMHDAANVNGYNIVTFVDNHDLRKDGLGIQNDAMLAYAYILTNNQIGAPCVFYPDYYGVQTGGTPLINLKTRINALMSLHQAYIYDSQQIDYLSRQGTPYTQYFVSNGNNGTAPTTLIYQTRPNSSGKNVLVAINFSGTPLDVYQKINTAWGASAGTTFNDALGYSSTPTTNITANNEIHVLLPPRSYTVYVQSAIPLPVELLDFQATDQKTFVTLDWQAASEQNFDRYEIERSTGDANHFEKIGEVKGQWVSAATTYAFYDRQPSFYTPLYYRLRMRYRDGQTEYSPIRQVQLGRKNMTATLLPNPVMADGVFTVEMATAETLHITAANTLGQIVLSLDWTATSGASQIPLPTHNWPTGTYYLTVQGATNQLSLLLEKW